MKITLAVVAVLVSAGAGTAYAAPFALTSTDFKQGGNIEQKNAGNIMMNGSEALPAINGPLVSAEAIGTSKNEAPTSTLALVSKQATLYPFLFMVGLTP